MKDFMLNSEGNAGSSQQVTKPTIATGTRETFVKERPILFSASMVRAILAGTKTQTRRVVKSPDPFCSDPRPLRKDYEVGMRLWVRETFNVGWLDGGKVLYRADGGSAKECGYPSEPKWKPAIFMPRHLSRITLEITEVRVQRVQEISTHDVLAEGIKYPDPNDALNEIGKFWLLWDSINAKRGFGWDANPWVWAITFKPLRATDEQQPRSRPIVGAVT